MSTKSPGNLLLAVLLIWVIGFWQGVQAEDAIPTPSVKGKVVDEKGEPVGGVEVHWFDWSKYKGYAKDLDSSSTTTDEQGNFSFELRAPMPSRIYQAWFVAHDAVGKRQGVAYAETTAVNENLVPQITLKPLHQVTVKVVDDQAIPIEAAAVDVANRASISILLGNTGGGVLSAKTNAEGLATLRLPADAWCNPIVAFKSGMGLDYFFIPGKPHEQQPQPLPTEITLKLTGARRVSIKALDKDDQPLAGVSFAIDAVMIQNKVRKIDDYGLAYGISLANCAGVQSVTDASGTAEFDWVPQDYDGRITFTLLSPDYNPWHQPAFSQSLPMLQRNDGKHEVTAYLVRKTKISGHVYFSDGKPAEGIDIRGSGTAPDGDSGEGFAQTKADGSYEMFAESDRAYIVSVVDDHWAALTHDRVIARETPVENIDFKLFPGTIVRGVVSVGADHRPVPQQFVNLSLNIKRPPGEEIRIQGSDGFRCGPFRRETCTNLKGEFRFCVGPGDYKINLQNPLGMEETFVFQELMIDKQPEIVVNLSVITRPLQGKVVNEDDQPVTDVVVQGVYNRHPVAPGFSFDAKATTGADGAFEFKRELVPLVLTAETRNKDLVGIVYVDQLQNKVKIRVAPLTEAQGRLLERTGKPVTEGILEYGIDSINRVSIGGRFFRGEATLDAEGRYFLENLVPNQEYEIRYRPNKVSTHIEYLPRFKVKSDGITYLGDISLQKDVPPN